MEPNYEYSITRFSSIRKTRPLGLTQGLTLLGLTRAVPDFFVIILCEAPRFVTSEVLTLVCLQETRPKQSRKPKGHEVRTNVSSFHTSGGNSRCKLIVLSRKPKISRGRIDLQAVLLSEAIRTLEA